MNERKKLLIIDDDPDFVDGIKSILEKADYAVEGRSQSTFHIGYSR